MTRVPVALFRQVSNWKWVNSGLLEALTELHCAAKHNTTLQYRLTGQRLESQAANLPWQLLWRSWRQEGEGGEEVKVDGRRRRREMNE